MDGTQHGAVAALLPQAGQLLPEAFLVHLAQHLAAQTGRHGFHLVPDGRELAGQLAVAGTGIGDAEGHALGQDAVRMYLLDLRCRRVGEIRKEHPAHGAGQLVQQAAGLAEVGILRKLADAGQRRASRPQPYSVLRIMAMPISKAAELDSPEPRSTSLAV